MLFEHDLLILYFISESTYCFLFFYNSVSATSAEQCFSKFVDKNYLRTTRTQEILSDLAVERTQLCEKLDYSNRTSKFSGILGDQYIILKNELYYFCKNYFTIYPNIAGPSTKLWDMHNES